MMKKKPIIICAVIFVVLLVAYFVVVRPLVQQIEEEIAETPETVEGEVLGNNNRFMMYPHVERSGMQSIEVRNQYGRYEFYRDSNNSFQIRGYEGTSYNLELFSNLVTSVGFTLSKTKVIDNASDARLEEYGLKDPQATWVLTTITGEKYKVYVGYDLLTGGGYYCKLDGRDSVYVLDTTLASTVLAPIESLCTPVLVAGLTQNDYFTVDNFTVMHGEDVMCVITRIPHEEQNNPEALVENIMSYPAPFYPNDTVYLGAIYSYLGLTGTEVVKLGVTDEDITQYGMENPAHTIYFEHNDQEIMLFFSELQEDNTYYVISSLFPHVLAKIDYESVSYLELDFIDWIDDYPFQQWLVKTSKLSIVGSGADVEFTLNHGVAADETTTLEVVSNTGVVIGNDDVYNFRQFFKTLLSIAILGYAELSEDEITALVSDDSNCILTFSISDLNGEETVYRFYPYSGAGRRSLMTVNGVGEFSVLTDLVEKIAADANRVLEGLDVNAYGKN